MIYTFGSGLFVSVLLMYSRGSKFIQFGPDVQLMVTILFFLTDSDFLMNPPLSMEVGMGIIRSRGCANLWPKKSILESYSLINLILKKYLPFSLLGSKITSWVQEKFACIHGGEGKGSWFVCMYIYLTANIAEEASKNQTTAHAPELKPVSFSCDYKHTQHTQKPSSRCRHGDWRTFERRSMALLGSWDIELDWIFIQKKINPASCKKLLNWETLNWL